MANTFVGTSFYMSPERISGKGHSSNCDIWSYGLTLMECAIGRYPFFSPNENNSSSKNTGYWALWKKICDDSPPLIEPSLLYSKEICNFINRW